MQNSKVINLLKGFTKEDIKRFGRYLESPLHNKDEKVVNLFNYLKKYYPSFDHKNLEKEVVAQKVYGEFKNKAFNRLSYFLSMLYKLMEDYLIWQELQEQKAEQDFLLLSAFRRRGKKEFYEKSIEKTKKEIHERSQKDVKYYFDAFRIADESLKEVYTVQIGDGGPILGQAMKQLDLFYFSVKLRYYQGLMTWKNITSTDVRVPLVKEVVEEIKVNYAENKLIKFYEQLYYFSDTKWSSEDRRTIYLKIKAMFFEDRSILTQDEKTEVMVLLTNYCIDQRKINPNLFYTEELAELYQFGIETKILFVEGELFPINFYNMVVIFCEANKNEWAWEFIDQYQIYLPDEFRTGIVGLSKATWHCLNNNYNDTLELLQGLVFEHYYYNILYRYLIARCFAEMNEEEALFNQLESFEKYVRRNKQMTEHMQRSLINYISFTRRILKSNYESDLKVGLVDDIKNTPALMFRKWLLKMASHTH